METRSLVFGVVEFREGVAELTAGDVELEALGHFRPLVVGARQRRNFGRVLHDEGRVPELLFHRFFKVQHLQARQRAGRELVFFFGQTQLLEGRDQPGGIVHTRASIGVLQDRFAHRQALEGGEHVHRLAVVGQRGVAVHLLDHMADQLLIEVHQVVVVPVGRVELHHGELGVVADADAFVAEVAVDLEHALETADQQALQVQLGRDAQEHFLIQRVVVRLEGFGVGTAGDRVQHRRFDLQEAVADHVVADAGQGLAAGDETAARGLVGHQVHIALAVLDFLVVHAVELVGQRAQALGDQAHAVGVDGQLTGARFEQHPFGRDDVAQVPVFEGGVLRLADAVVVQVDLDAPARRAERRVLQRGEAGLAHHALEHHAARDAGTHGRGLQRLLGGFAVGGEQRFCLVARFEVVRKRHALATRLRLPQGFELLAPLRNQLVVIGGGVGVGVFGGHGVGQIKTGCATKAQPTILSSSEDGLVQDAVELASPGHRHRPLGG